MGQQVFAQSDYVTITGEHCPPEIVYISENGENYIKKNILEKTSDKHFNYNPIIKIVKDYEKKVYKLKVNTFGGSTCLNYFLLVRKEDE